MFRFAGGNLIAEVDGIQAVFDGRTGSLRELRNTVGDQELLADGGADAPWRLAPQGALWHVPAHVTERFTMPEVTPRAFAFDVAADDDAATLRWATSDPGIAVVVDVRRAQEGPGLALWPRVEVADGTVPPLRLTYPLLAPRELSDDDVLVFPAQQGYLVRHPLRGEALSTFYPDGYDGCSLQLMAHYAPGVGGLYLAAHDPHGTVKHLTFGPHAAGFEHEAWDLRSGASMDLDYPVVLAPLAQGHWFEAVDRYRAWALPHAPWAGGGVPNVLRDDVDDRRWLYAEVGLSVWGAPSSLDWSPWYRFYADAAGTPLHIASGWDWPVGHPHSVGREGWFPAQFHPNNVAAWEGHHVTPYMNDLFISDQAERFMEDWEPNLLYPHTPFNWAPFSEPRPGMADRRAPSSDPRVTTNHDLFLCPATEAQRELHAWRDATLVEDYNMAGVCYDISSGNPRVGSRCIRAEHGHAPGRGREIIQAYDGVNRRSKELTRERTGRYLVQGVEVIIENVIGAMDFTVARACAGPLGALEAWSFGRIEPPGGDRELIPLFQAVYHDVGPVHEDGWLTLSTDEGALFYWIAARITLQWGGLLSLHYANNRPERLPGHDGPAELIDWDGARVTFDGELPEADPDKIAFIRALAAARTRFATRYLAYGRMLRPVELTPATVELDYDQRFEHLAGVRNAGRWPVPEVVHGAWADHEGSIGVLLSNVRGDTAVETRLVVEPGHWDVDVAGRAIRRVVAGGAEAAGPAGASAEATEVGRVADDGRIDLVLSLPPRSVMLVELPA